MEFIIEHEEIDRLLRKALASEGVQVPDGARMAVRQNHKKGTIRAVFQTKREEGEPEKGSDE